MKTYTIWSEGYVTNGERAGALKHGTAIGTSFVEACRTYFGDSPYYDYTSNTYWGCHLFDNEQLARVTFG